MKKITVEQYQEFKRRMDEIDQKDARLHEELQAVGDRILGERKRVDEARSEILREVYVTLECDDDHEHVYRGWHDVLKFVDLGNAMSKPAVTT